MLGWGLFEREGLLLICSSRLGACSLMTWGRKGKAGVVLSDPLIQVCKDFSY